MHKRALAVFADVLTVVGDDDLDRPTPCSDWTVADLLHHVVEANQSSVTNMGEVPVDVSDRDRVAAHAAVSAQSREVFSASGWSDKMVELPFATLPATVFAAIRSGDCYIHAWDLATAIGADNDLDRELGEEIMAVTAPLVPPDLRGPGRPFAAQQPCSPDRPIADRLAAFFGRQV